MRDDLLTWLERMGLAQYASLFAKAGIDLPKLHGVTDHQLQDLGVHPSHRAAILNAARSIESGRGSAQRAPLGASDALNWRRDEADRRPLTVLFCDLVGSVQLSNAVDPEDFRVLLNLYRHTCGLPIERFGGFVARYIGDGILAYFGYPSAHEDDAERAISAGLEILALMRDFKPEPRLLAKAELAVRIGIASSSVVVGKIEGGAAVEEVEVTGEAPNLAARLHAFASPGTVVVDPRTRHLAIGRFHYATLGEQSLKGFDQPVSVWRVLGERATSRFGARRRRQTPLVGREEHFACLTACWQKVRAGRGQGALICGKAGIGKSRLAEAIRDFVLSHPANGDKSTAVAIRLQCSPYHANAALYPVIRVLERLAEFQPSDTSTRKLKKLSALIAESQIAEPQEALGLLTTLLALPAEKPNAAPLERSDLRLRQLRFLQLWIELVANSRPVLVTWEDVQWIDPTSRDLLEQLLVSAKRSAVFVIATQRIEPGSDQSEKSNFQFSDWISRSDILLCALDELTQEQGRQLARNVARGKNLPESVTRTIAERGQGNPLFIEELTRGWLTADAFSCEPQSSRWQTAAIIPDTLSGALMARVDQTGPLREIVLHAAVIGGEFDCSLLSTAAELSHEVVSVGLTRLVAAEIFGCTRHSAETSYFFKHSLVQEVAYASL